MVKFTRCPKCSTLYELEGVDYVDSGGWVQCGDCNRKFKVDSHAVEPDELSFTVSSYAAEESMKIEGAAAEEHIEASMQVVDNAEKKPSSRSNQLINELIEEKLTGEEVADSFLIPELDDDSAQNIEKQQLKQQTQSSNSEFLEKTIILPEEITDDEHFEDIFNDFSDDIFNPEFIEEDESEVASKKVKNTYAELHSEFSEEEIVIESEFSKKTLLEEELETNSYGTVTETISQNEGDVKATTIGIGSSPARIISFFTGTCCLLLMFGLIALFVLQIHGRGTYEWIPQKNYDGLLSRFPILTKLEKTQTDLSAIHLASTRMEVNSTGDNFERVISLELVNRSFVNQAYPDFQLEFTDAKGEIIARRIIFPSMYLDQGHFGFLESKQAKIVFFNLESLPEGTIGYQVKVVQQNG